MILRGITLRGLIPFDRRVDVPIGDLGDSKLVAVHGRNGEGKTTILECVPGALYRQLPSRGAIHESACARDSLVEVTLETDQVYTARLMINGLAKTPKTEAYLIGASGRPLCDGKAREYDAEIARRFPSREVMLSSSFAAQNGAGRFLALPKSERKALFARLLGLGRLEAIASSASERGRDASMSAASARAAAEIAQSHLAEVGALNVAVETATAKELEARSERQRLEAERIEAEAVFEVWLAESGDLAAAYQLARAQASDAGSQRDALQKRMDDISHHVDRAESSIATCELRLSERDALSERAAGVGAAEAGLYALEAELQSERDIESRMGQAAIEYERRRADLEAAVRQAKSEHSNAVCAARAEVDNAWRKVGESRDAIERLGAVPCGGSGEYAACPLIGAAVAHRDALGARRSEAAEAETSLANLLTCDPGDGKEAAALANLGDPPPQYDASKQEVLRAKISPARAELAACQRAATQLEALSDAEDMLALEAEELASLKAVRADIEASTAPAAAALLKAQEAVYAAGLACQEHAKRKPAFPDVGAIAAAHDAECKHCAEAALATERLRTAEQAAIGAGEAEAKAGAAEREAEDWTHLATAFGRDGIQALEIDAAGPAISELATDLMRACYGSRFTLSLETTRLKATGKGTREVFDLRIIDAEHGAELSADKLSGGQKVLVNEALSLAIAIYNCRQSEQPLLDLFRDECSGALDSENAVLYVEMLRRAIDVGGFHRCYFIAHQPELWELADARLHVHNGQVDVG